MHEFIHILIHTLEHGLHILPFLFIAFLIIEFIEHKLKSKNLKAIKQLNKIIENARKVIELIDERSYTMGFVDDLEFINKYLRHGERCDGCEHTIIL